MDNEVSISETPGTPKEVSRPLSWQELRNRWADSPYSEHYEAAARRIKQWEATPRIGTDPNEWNNQVNGQITKAKQLLTGYHPDQATMIETNKIVTVGTEHPKNGQETLTRLYLGLDPRHATDAYMALLDELSDGNCLKDIEVALNLEELEAKKLRGNTIIIYDPLSRPEVLNKVLAAYYAAKDKAPEAFNLTPRQKATVMRENLRQFKATIDANLSFVEMPAEEGGRSYDSGSVQDTYKAFGMHMGEYTDEEWLKMVKEREHDRVVYTYADREKIEKGQVQSGDVMHYKRKLTVPALVQYGTITVK